MALGTILLMRHGEKTGDTLDPHLSPSGYARAASLPDFIKTSFGLPSALFAAALSRHSNRPFETLAPLSQTTGVPIDTTFADQDYAALAQRILSNHGNATGLSVVCWHHGNIPSLANALDAPALYPNPWNPSVFNLILRIDCSNCGPTQMTMITEPF